MDTATAMGRPGATYPPDEVIAGCDFIQAIGVACARRPGGWMELWQGSNGTVRVEVTHTSAGRLSWHVKVTTVSGHLPFAEGWGPTFAAAHAALRDAIAGVVLAAGSVSL